MEQDEKIVGAMPVYNFDEDRYITIFTKDGMVKRTLISELKATRYTKPMPYMKLKTGDKVVVISGANKGKEGKITKVLDEKVIVEGVNVCKKHLKPKNNNGEFGSSSCFTVGVI